MRTLDKESIREIIRQKASQSFTPSSVYRLQLNPDFPFSEARKRTAYFERLGIDAIYTSPIFQARQGSMHGYDVTDPNHVNPALGGEEELEAFCHALKEAKLSHVMDVVPNHMGIGDPSNQWWQDVLENGKNSMYARFFDIDWAPEKKELKDKVLLPVLGDQYGQVLENGDLRLFFENGAFFIRYWDHRFPVSPDTYPLILARQFKQNGSGTQEERRSEETFTDILRSLQSLHPVDPRDYAAIYERNRQKEIAKQRLAQLAAESPEAAAFIGRIVEELNGSKGNPESFDFLDTLLNHQYYRLSYWRVAAHEINYRRFFNVNDLAAIRMEDKQVFDAYHWMLFCLLSEGKVQGIRIDHPDGLSNPSQYFRMLQRQYLLLSVAEAIKKKNAKNDENSHWEIRKQIEEVLDEKEFETCAPLMIIVEKILDRRETLPEDWAVCGTVGYEYLNALSGLFVQRDNEKAFTAIYEKFTGTRCDFSQLVYEKKKFFAAFDMASELNTAGFMLDQLSEHNRKYRDFTLNDLITAIREVIACFPVYRTYITPEATAVSERDEHYIRIAIEIAKSKHPTLSTTIFDFIQEILLLKIHADLGREEDKAYREFILKFQQLSAPIMAKGLEDTAFYLYNRFIALNEVGGDPEHFGYSKGDFHRINLERSRRHPKGFLATSTHDTKRSEDVRMRLDVLSEIPGLWQRSLAQWTRLNKKHKTLMKKGMEPNRNTEYFIYQTLLGVWPDEPFADKAAYEAFGERVWHYVQKAVREAKVETNWLNPNAAYEDAVKRFLTGILERAKSNKFLEGFSFLQKRIAEFGKWNALAALTLKLGSPGIVDTYQGNEIWDYSLVDPDNRRPVDYGKRLELLEAVEKGSSALKDRPSFLEGLLREKTDGRIKLYVLREGLSLRKKTPGFFTGAEYVPLEVRGGREDHVIAFMRRLGDKAAVVAAARYLTGLWDFSEDPEWHRDVWAGTCVVLPKECGGMVFEDLFSAGKPPLKADGESIVLPCAELFSKMPGAFLINWKP